MQKYQKTYLKEIGFDFNDPSVITDIKSEISGQRADDIHHIKYLMNGIDRQDYPFERLIALTRDEHYKFGDKKQYFDYLLWMHGIFMGYHGIKQDFKWLPNSVFYLDDPDLKVNLSARIFWNEVYRKKYYVEVWDSVENCRFEIYNQSGRIIQAVTGETKEDILLQKISL